MILSVVGTLAVGISPLQAEILRVVDSTRATLSALDLGRERSATVEVTADKATLGRASGIEAILSEISGKVEARAEFDDQGSALFPRIAPGTYSLKVAHGGVKLDSIKILPEEAERVAAAGDSTDLTTSVLAVGSGVALGAVGLAVGAGGDGDGVGGSDGRSGLGADSSGGAASASVGGAASSSGAPTLAASAAPNPGTPSPAPTTITANPRPRTLGPSGSQTITQSTPTPPTTQPAPPVSGD